MGILTNEPNKSIIREARGSLEAVIKQLCSEGKAGDLERDRVIPGARGVGEWDVLQGAMRAILFLYK